MAPAPRGEMEVAIPGLRYDVLETTLGWVGVLTSGRGIRGMALPEPTPDEAVAHLGPEVRHAQLSPGAFSALHAKLERYFRGEPVTFDEPLDLEGAGAFFRAAWRACQGIPRGETRSYAWLAAQAGRPKAPRTAGQAMARNRIPIVIPCHRVVGSNGDLGGYGGGLDLKRQLLSLEKGRGS